MAPLALIAYPEAYEELRRTVLLLVVNEGDGLFGCTDKLWLKQTSTLVAAMFSRTIRQAAGRWRVDILHTSPSTEGTTWHQDPCAHQLKDERQASNHHTPHFIDQMIPQSRQSSVIASA